eukprot:3751682-Rhodomonas_salina.3
MWAGPAGVPLLLLPRQGCHRRRLVRDVYRARPGAAEGARTQTGIGQMHACVVVGLAEKDSLHARSNVLWHGPDDGVGCCAVQEIAEELDRSPGEVAKKLEDMRNRLLQGIGAKGRRGRGGASTQIGLRAEGRPAVGSQRARNEHRAAVGRVGRGRLDTGEERWEEWSARPRCYALGLLEGELCIGTP